MLTAERKKRGKKPPEGLFSAEDISNFRQTASHPVSETLYQLIVHCEGSGLPPVGSAQRKCSWNIGPGFVSGLHARLDRYHYSCIWVDLAISFKKERVG